MTATTDTTTAEQESKKEAKPKRPAATKKITRPGSFVLKLLSEPQSIYLVSRETDKEGNDVYAIGGKAPESANSAHNFRYGFSTTGVKCESLASVILEYIVHGNGIHVDGMSLFEKNRDSDYHSKGQTYYLKYSDQVTDSSWKDFVTLRDPSTIFLDNNPSAWNDWKVNLSADIPISIFPSHMHSSITTNNLCDTEITPQVEARVTTPPNVSNIILTNPVALKALYKDLKIGETISSKMKCPVFAATFLRLYADYIAEYSYVCNEAGGMIPTYDTDLFSPLAMAEAKIKNLINSGIVNQITPRVLSVHVTNLVDTTLGTKLITKVT